MHSKLDSVRKMLVTLIRRDRCSTHSRCSPSPALNRYLIRHNHTLCGARNQCDNYTIQKEMQRQGLVQLREPGGAEGVTPPCDPPTHTYAHVRSHLLLSHVINTLGIEPCVGKPRIWTVNTIRSGGFRAGPVGQGPLHLWRQQA